MQATGWRGWLIGAGAALYVGAVIACSSPFAGGADSSGYMNFARILLAGSWTEPSPKIEGLAAPGWTFWRQQPLGFEANRVTGELTPTYPVGVPLHLAAVGWLVGLERASTIVNVALVISSALLMFALARRLGLEPGWAGASVVCLWASPLYFLNTLQPMSDLAALTWSLATIYAAVRARERWPWGVLAGMAMSVAVLVRPADAVLILPIAVVLGIRIRTWAALVAGGVPGALFMGWMNAKLYGSVFNTGYGDMSWFFRWAYVGPNAVHFAKWLPVVLSPPVIMVALGLPLAGRRFPLVANLATAWFATFAGFYVFYSFLGQEWWYLRFLLPAFPAVILAAMFVGRMAAENFAQPGVRRVVLGVAFVFALGWDAAVGDRLNVTRIARTDEAYRLVAEWMLERLPDNAIVLQSQLSGALTYYTDFASVRWDTVEDEATWNQLRRAAAEARRPIYAALYDFEVERAFSDAYVSGIWDPVVKIRQMSVWKLREVGEGRSG